MQVMELCLEQRYKYYMTHSHNFRENVRIVGMTIQSEVYNLLAK